MKRGIFIVLIGVLFLGCSKVRNSSKVHSYVYDEIDFLAKNSLSKVEQYALSTDGKYLAMMSDYQKVKVLNLETLELVEIDLSAKVEEKKDGTLTVFENSDVFLKVGNVPSEKLGGDKKFGIMFGTNPVPVETSELIARAKRQLRQYGTTQEEREEQSKYSDKLCQKEENDFTTNSNIVTSFSFYKNMMLFHDMRDIYVIDLKSKKVSKRIKLKKVIDREVTFSKDGKSIIFCQKRIVKKLDIETGQMTVIPCRSYEAILSSSINKGLKVLKKQDDSLYLYNKQTNQELATIKLFKNQNRGRSVTILGTKYENINSDSWFIMTPEGYYVGSDDAYRYFDVEKSYEKFYRPDLIKQVLQGKSIAHLPKISDVKIPPIVRILNTEKEVDTDSLEILVKILPQDGGVGDVRLYHNNTAVVETKAVSSAKPFERSFKIKLVEGENKIKAIAFESTNSKSSDEATFSVVSTKKSVKKSNLYALVIGVEEFRNASLDLKHPYEDAKLFEEILKAQEGGLFEKVFVTSLASKEQTTKENILTELEKFKTIGKNDLFVLYVSSHGTVENGEYYLVTSNVGSLSTHKLQQEALSGEAIKKIVSNIDVSKKLMVFDTCFSGALGDLLGTDRLYTKGLSEKSAIDRFNKATGSAILSASTASDEAIANGYKGYSIFTRILVDGLEGLADDGITKDGFVKTSELVNYVDNELPKVSSDKFKYEQFPTNNSSGQPFSVSKVQ
jgi:hypothetical protein